MGCSFLYLDAASYMSQPPSLENPFVGAANFLSRSLRSLSQPPSLENPFVGWSSSAMRDGPPVSTSKPGESLCGVREFFPDLDLYYVSTSKPGESLCGTSILVSEVKKKQFESQPPSLENPFVGLLKQIC